MAGSTFGQLFRVTTAGESHGKGYAVIIDAPPAGVEFSIDDLQTELNRRRPGQSAITTPRNEKDQAQIISGIFEGKTTGTPVCIFVENMDFQSEDYSHMKDLYRPGHADYTLTKKFGIRDYRGGGRASARETIARVCAGALAKKILNRLSITTIGYVKQIGHITIKETFTGLDREVIESNAIRCPNPLIAAQMIELIANTKNEGDSIGGIAEFVIHGVPIGLGEPVFDKLRADFAKALFSIPAVVGVEVGEGFSSVLKKGSEFNDQYKIDRKSLIPLTNNQGGMHGGISNGGMIILRCAVRPTSTIAKEQNSFDKNQNPVSFKGTGRHDPCILPRFVPVAEAMISIVLVDHWLRKRANQI